MTSMNDQRTYFDQLAHRYPQPNTVNPPYAQLLELLALESSLKLKPASTIIDFGAGNGRVSLYFLKKDIMSLPSTYLNTRFTRYRPSTTSIKLQAGAH